MQKVYVVSGIVIMFVICITLVIFAPKQHVFHNIKDYYPELLKHFHDAQVELIHKEVDAGDWEDCPDEWVLKGSYKRIKLYDESEYMCDIRKYAHTVNIISQIPGLKGAYLGRLGSKTILKVRKTDKNHMHVSIPLEKGFETADQCGVWVKRETRALHRKIMYDTSKIFSMYNKTDIPTKFLILEMEWPSTLKAQKKKQEG